MDDRRPVVMSDRPTIDHARELLRARFGYPDFRVGQASAVESVLAGRDTLVIVPTGGGKSLCYQVPALLLRGLTVVISPLISLMKDQVDALERRALPAAFINSTLSAGEIGDRLARAERGELKLLYVAPERFDAGNTAERLRRAHVALLAVDEAHCISEWGHDFRPSYLRIRTVRDRLGAPPTVALTATATPEVRRDIVQQLALRTPHVVVAGFDRKNLSYHVARMRTAEQKDAALVDTLRRFPGLAVIYASTRRGVDRITASLEKARVRAAGYHAGLDDAHRRTVQEQFMAEEVRAIVATNAFGMGIDKPNVRLVVHYAMPGTLESYYQEAGRAGRDGEHADCVLLHAFQDRFTHEFFIRSAYPERSEVEKVFRHLRGIASPEGLVSATPQEIAATHKGMKPRAVESALRVLAGAGVVASESATSSQAFVRLLATPRRIRAELADEPMLLDLLRAIWRLAGKRFEQGTWIDCAGFAPGFGGAAGVMAVLDALQARQFISWSRPGGGIRLLSAEVAADRLPVDWASLDRRREADMGKLEAIQRYAYTKGCRRGFVLRYFGDPDARNHCTGCDNCLGTHAGDPEPAAERPRASRLKRLADAVRAPGRARRDSGNGHATFEADDLSSADRHALERLRDLRTTLAREARVPAYVVFPDRTLLEMAVRRPRSADALAQVRGVGPAKLERYGPAFLAVLRELDAPPPG
ncbi:MAG TPA: ATP-dependent DNA helicase RecQ [Gemmatimonadaceae bacterium]|nr:ATP-dependent DNA helicase RecQ [Gemmatimonadaceae bacterium]